MKQEDPQFKLRLPPDLKERLEVAAKVNNRTLGAEVVERLQKSVLPAETVVPIRWGTEGHVVNVVLPEQYVNEVVRPDILKSIKSGLDHWEAEERREQADSSGIQLVRQKRA